MDTKKSPASQDYANNFEISDPTSFNLQTSLDDVVTINTLQSEYPHLFTKQQLSWLLKTRHKNGLEQLGAILKISRKLYIKKSLFIDWFLNQKAGDS